LWSRAAVLMQAYRWIEDSRDEFTKERLEALDDSFKVGLVWMKGPLPFLRHWVLVSALTAPLFLAAVSVPHHHELFQGMPQAPQPGTRHRTHQEEAGHGLRRLRAPVSGYRIHRESGRMIFAHETPDLHVK
jgi:hypothetical protein